MAATAPDLILLNADIRTMDPLLPRARALAVREGRVVALGDEDEIRGLANGRTRKVDAGGRLVLPGFQDTHIHLQDSGTGFSSSVDLAGARNVPELQDLVQRLCRAPARRSLGPGHRLVQRDLRRP